MKQYQNLLAQSSICRRDNDHAMAAELAESIRAFWLARGDKAKHTKWLKAY
ncbi:hypothetical protein ACK323_05560 [Aeromonas enteropelogenes]|uniref:hypothetical protein n=1 Tax=Aeromonas TaxID=642 RepID=UPI002B2AA11B|nr:hypothetical protein VAWG006_25710 [Aeromonas enteropelogenes]BEE22480.1 hypothetical protein VAWG007_25750 [Aeromonas enteropelogenes]